MNTTADPCEDFYEYASERGTSSCQYSYSMLSRRWRMDSGPPPTRREVALWRFRPAGRKEQPHRTKDPQYPFKVTPPRRYPGICLCLCLFRSCTDIGIIQP